MAEATRPPDPPESDQADSDAPVERPTPADSEEAENAPEPDGEEPDDEETEGSDEESQPDSEKTAEEPVPAARAEDYLTEAGFLTQVVLIGASALIPVPFVDDLVGNYLERRLFRATAAQEGFELSGAEVKAITSAPKGCCVKGCLSNALLYPIKKLIRKLLFVLEIKRAIDQASEVLVRCWLFRCALSQNWWAPDGSTLACEQLNQALRLTCQQEGTSPFYHAVAGVFRSARGVLKNLGELLTGEAKALKDETEEKLLEDGVHKVEQAGQAESLAASLGSALGALPADYLERLTAAFHRHLATASSPTEGGLNATR